MAHQWASRGGRLHIVILNNGEITTGHERVKISKPAPISLPKVGNSRIVRPGWSRLARIAARFVHPFWKDLVKKLIIGWGHPSSEVLVPEKLSIRIEFHR